MARIAGVNIPQNKLVQIGLTYIYGIGDKFSQQICKDLEISNRSGPKKKETDDNEVKHLIKKMIKQRNESIDIYKKNNRADLLAIEEKEVNILSTYLPKQLSDEETEDVCRKTINETNAQNIKDMGKVMGILKKNYSDNLDFSKAGAILKEMLNK